ncbi:Zinc finger protein ZFPM1 [Myotis davidii]|uniref:Zinc finger protein ZFPM1 n=1 Tax=Myotis davidii TaxID=225400 RepID=L5LZD7_MYODS|nr:Zinc finger protein ZFPM1 [Myotis davidii]
MKWEGWNLLTGLLFMVLREVTTGSRVGRAGGKAESSSSAAVLGWASGCLGSQGRKAVLSTSINLLTSTYTAANPADELEQVLQDGQRCVRARRSLAEGLSWGPFHGSIQSRASSPRQAEPSPALTLLLEDEACWLKTLPRALTEAEANVEIHRKDGALWCRLTKPVPAGGLLSVLLTAEPHSTPNHPVKKEPAEPEGLAPSHTDIQLLPQQAGMASILATAVINKDVFPCKDCGIWYRSERNLQAHLLYYCASRQSAGSPAAAAADEKPKEPYPNERVCPFPQCRKSCPSASSLEIHMRSHSGERPFVCLICLSAFTTKANCERHLKVHTDTQSGVCHSCGFISTTRDILYSHLVTNHMVCQPGSKAEIYSPGVGHPSAKLPPGLAQAGPAPALKSGPWGLPADSLPGFQQLTALHGPLASSDLGLGSTSSPGLDRKALGEATNGEARTAPQNGGSSEPPAAPRSIKGVQTPSKGTPASLPNGNHRYCRLCNIKFSSLSTFIAHKKYYCSSHAAEHVK